MYRSGEGHRRLDAIIHRSRCPVRRVLVRISVALTVTLASCLPLFAQSGAVTYLYDALGRLVAVIDGTGATAIYTYDPVGNLLSIQRQDPGTVSILAFSPAAAAPGATVTISGTGFSTTANQNALSFNGTAATVTASTSTQLTATVPAAATTGPLSVTTPSGSATSAQAFVVSGAPAITDFTPSAGSPGTSVTVSGQNFETLATNDLTYFNGRIASVTSASATSLVTAVPNATTSGRITVATPSGTAVSAADFFVPPSPYTPASISATGRLTNGTATTITISPANTIGLLVFDGTVDQLVAVQLTGNTIGSVTVSLLKPDGTTLTSKTVSSASFALTSQWLPVSGTYTLFFQPGGTNTGSITTTITLTPAGGPLPSRPPALLDTNHALAANLAGLFVMNEGGGTLTTNLVDGQVATFAGSTTPTWNTSDPSVVMAGGGSLGSYVDAGADLTFDQLPVSQTTVVAKIWVNTVAAAGVVEKNDASINGFVFGIDAFGTLKLRVLKSSVSMDVATANGAIGSGRWIQLAFTWDGTVGTAAAAHLFVNGAEQPKVTALDGSGTLSNTTARYQPLRIGNGSLNTTGSLNGKVAYVAIYKGRLLTTSELTQLDSALPLVATNATILTPNSSPTTVSPTGPSQPATLTFSTATTQVATVQLTANTLGSVTVALICNGNTTLQSVTSSSSSFALPAQVVTGTCRIVVTPAGSTTGSIGVAVTLAPLPNRPASVLDANSTLATNLAGLFVMNEGSGTLTTNLVDGQVATLAGSTTPTWNASDPSVVMAGGSSLASYLDAGADLSFDQLPVSRMTVVAKVWVNTVAAAGVVEKNDGGSLAGFVFGGDTNGALKLTFVRTSANMQVATANGAIGSGRWIQLAFTWDGTVGTAAAAHLFVNGVEQPKATATDGSGTLGYTNATYRSLRIGNASFGLNSTGSLNGKVAYVAIYKGRLLTTSELTQLDSALPLVATNATILTPNSSPTTVSPTGPSQPATLTFSTATTQVATVQLTANTLGSVTVALICNGNTTLQSVTSSSSSFALPAQAVTGTCRIVVTPAGSTTGSIGVAVTLAPLPNRPTGAVLDANNGLSTNLAGLFVMNEGSGATDLNLVDSQTASVAGSTPPTWNTSDPSLVFNGGGSLGSYLNAGADLTFDKLPISKVTLVAKVYVSTLTNAGVAEKNDGDVNSGFVFGEDSAGALKLTFVKSSADMKVATASGAITSGRWIQVAYTWDGTVGTAAAAHLFINGIEQPKVTATDGSGTLGYANATNKPFKIGAGSFYVTGSLNGKIAYLAVYKGRILSASELVQLDSQLPIH